MTDSILVLNAGSSSIKFAIIPASADPVPPVLRGKIAGIGNKAVLSARDAAGENLTQDKLLKIDPAMDHEALIPGLLDWLNNHHDGFNIIAAGHRVVHGGRDHSGPARVTETLLNELEKLSPLAPLHQPHNLAVIRSVAAGWPDLPQVACFDTAFHQTQKPLAKLFALPRSLTDEGIIRYGFHGLSYEYIADTLHALLGNRADGRVIVAHLGNGASICAMKDRRSVATSMGFTALDGLVMGRRCGAIDPGVLLYLMESRGMQVSDVSHLLYRQSGLLGVSGISNNMQDLEASTAPEAREAIDLFCYRAACEIGSLAVANGGLDAIVFTAGIGENSALVRHLICSRLRWLGVELSEPANQIHATRISAASSQADVLVVQTDEESVMARATFTLTSDAGN